MNKFTSLSMGWSRGKDFIPSGIIRKIDNSYFNHVFWVFELSDGVRLMYESHLSGGVQITPYEQLLKAWKGGKVLDFYEKCMDFTDDEIERVWDSCVTLHGDGYDKGQIIRYYLWTKCFKRKTERVLRLYDDGKYTCNELVVTSVRANVDRMACLDYSYTPEMLFMFEHSGRRSKDVFEGV